MDNSHDDSEDYQLPADTLLVLQEFLREKELREKAETTGVTNSAGIEENWQLSQFWYNENTKEKLASVVDSLHKKCQTTENDLRVALLCCPSLYNHVKKITENVTLFEFDERFASIGSDFHHFDYKQALEETYLDDSKECFDLIIADPPFLSEECIEKIGIVVQKIAKNDCKTILCSGYAVRDWAKKFLHLDLCKFEPEHERNLGNQFSSYANFDLDGELAGKM
ncbi:protein-lysine N-methyltransferase CG9154 [Toxorhynchites rutilus septentrionalis]|uniref:protein-lysine N-methyltransferase CG9154 n=1 Tax=Toxorhynchites rutilus septentrionalis TaxID=329112 RepID=UPI002478FBDC|nr:protein-lysine N-methyltransferase CG9154 [Toxorhynchites rutilus septentrionalis]